MDVVDVITLVEVKINPVEAVEAIRLTELKKLRYKYRSFFSKIVVCDLTSSIIHLLSKDTGIK